MHVVSDDERREVARMLRELHLNPWDDAACEIAQCAGIACCNSECHGSNETPECTVALCAHLADLIDPDTTTDTTKSPELTTKCDRDALLAQAKELEKCAWYFGLDFDADEPLWDRLKEASEDFAGCARRIREACGEVDG